MSQVTEKFEFQTEVSKLLKLMIHSLYSNSDVFLRELVSNASDACDKQRFAALDDDGLYGGDSELKIQIRADEENRLLTISDNGIGMSRQELIDNLGTIANSGTAKFLEQMTGDQKKDAHLIGQFGVGFYSAFIVADEVTVRTRKAGESEATLWRSTGEGSFEIETIEKSDRGTQIELKLKEDASTYVNQYKLTELVKRYADHITVPVELYQPEQEKTEYQESKPAGFEQINDAQALWTRDKTELSDEEYQGFYSSISHDFMPPLKWVHNKVEGSLNYTSLLYLPAKAPFDLYNRDANKGLKLFIQRVFIMDDAEQFLPMYLRFIKGVLDCADLPLNVSREILQNAQLTNKLKTALTKRVLSMINALADDNEAYLGFWKEFGVVLKEGLVEDPKNQEKIAGLLRYQHLSAEGLTSLDDYIAQMKPSQEGIYYLTAESEAAAKQSPLLEIFEKNGYDVLIMTDQVDEWVMQQFNQYKEKSFVDIARGELPEDLTQESDEAQDDESSKSDGLFEQIKTTLGDKVSDVRFSKRLVSSPSCLVLSAMDLGPQMKKIMEASGQSMPDSQPILELNASHRLVKHLQNAQEAEAQQLIHVLFGQAELAEGRPLSEPEHYVKSLNELLAKVV